MAIYSTFFLCDPQDLTSRFQGWKLPLPEPVVRTIKNPFTQEEITVTSQEPDWEDYDPTNIEMPEYKVVEIQGDYQDYLEQRVPQAVQQLPHWCSKNLTMIEMNPLVATICSSPGAGLKAPLFSPPTLSSGLEEFPAEFSAKLKEMGSSELRVTAANWAAIMSTPEHTHSVAGTRLNDGWAVEEALGILQPISELTNRQVGDQTMYLLYEG